ncbi:Mucin-associated surface protein (MASP) [Trypanosoma cruzi]|uniref:Mucin-associated surface protein (MASP) n=1 Tax=Trypanosoma cruzi TaxID=5693 RepID=A0A2V2UTF6_TRYCR|nr:Mucin-associated surface protein (MASP) [Trypanosoma cruzi]
MKCVLLLLVFFTAPCFLLLLCVDWELVCAEGYTRVTGVMSMIMAGRVLLVCALCVLWCGAGGGYAEDVDVVSGDPGTRGERGGGTVGQTPPAGGSNGGSGGSKADIPHGSESEPLDSASDEESSSLDIDQEVGPNPPEENVPQKEVDHIRKQDHSESGPQEALPPDVNGTVTLDSDAQLQLSDTKKNKKKTKVLTDVVGGEIADGGKDSTGRNNGLSPNKNYPQPLLKQRIKQVLPPKEPSPPPADISPAPQEVPTVVSPTERSPAITVSAGETNPTASTDSQNTTETTTMTSPSNAETAPEAEEKPLGNGEPSQNRQDTDTPDSMNDSNTSRPAETAASSVSKSGSGGAQNKEDKVDNGAQRPNSREPQDGIEGGNTNNTPTSTETAPQKQKQSTTIKQMIHLNLATVTAAMWSPTPPPLFFFLLRVRVLLRW